MEEIAKANHYRSYYEVAKKITNPEARLAFYDAIDAYRFEGEIPENLPFEADLAFTAIKANIDADVNRKNGGAPKNNKNAQKKQPQNNEETNVKQPKNNLKTTVVLKKTNKEEVEEKEEVEVNAKVEGEVKEKENEKVEEKGINPLKEQPLNYGKTIFDLVSVLNGTCRHKIPVNFTQFAFENKECREFLESVRGIHSNDQLQAIRNLFAVLNLDNPRYYPKSWKQFCMNMPEYLPGNFCIDNYKAVKNGDSERQSGAFSEAEKKAAQLEAMKKAVAV